MREFDPAHAAAHGYTREDWDSVDSPELTDEELAQARPLKESLPELHEALTGSNDRGDARHPDEPVSVRLDDDVAKKFRATGEGWQARANEVLRRASIEEIVREPARRRADG